LSGSVCPHFDGEKKRKPAYLELIGNGSMKAGFGVDDCAALHFINEQLHQSVSSRENAAAYQIKRQAAGASLKAIPTTCLY
jgi:dipeptidase E